MDMEASIECLQDTFKISFDCFEDSRAEADEVMDLFHNRQYSDSQLSILANRGQPAETFNIVKLFTRLMLGYYSTVVNSIKISPRQYNDILTASLLNDVVDYTMENNQMETEGDKLKLDGLTQGLMCIYIDIKATGQKDKFGRVIYRIELSHVPAEEIALDPMSRLEDYSDARYIHRFKWVSEGTLRKEFKGKKTIIDKLQAYHNHLLIDDAEFTKTYNEQFNGRYKRYDNYLLVHSIITDDRGKTWSVYWVGDEILRKEEISFKEVRFPYRVQRIHTSNKTEYYGVFREVKETQKAINQALIKIQLMVNTQKAFIEKGGVENIAEFTDQFNRVNAVIPVNSLKKIKIESLTREVLDQYTIIDKALDRIQRVLGVNDSFLGMAFASDSGRKVKLQQNQTILALRYVSVRIEQFYRLLGWDIVNLIKQYYTADQVLKITDETVGDRWIQINKPMTVWTGQMDPTTGQPQMQYVWEEVLDPATGKPQIDDNGNIIIAPIPTGETEIAFTDVDLTIDSVIYNDEDEKNQLMLETILSGNIGQMLSQVNPSGYFQAAALSVKVMKTKHSLDIGEILTQTAQMASQMAQAGAPTPVAGGETQQRKSASMKLPQNTDSTQ